MAITLEDVVVALKLSPAREWLEQLIATRVAAARAEAASLEVDHDELDEAVAGFYAERELFEDAQIDRWLDETRLTSADVHGHVRAGLLVRRLRDYLAPDEAVAARFRSSPHDFATVSVEIAAWPSAGAASELMLQVREGETDWLAAARRAESFSGEVLRRSDAPEEIASSLFAAAPGELVGPVELDNGGHAVYRVLFISAPELDEDVRESIRAELFAEEMARAIAADPVRFAR